MDSNAELRACAGLCTEPVGRDAQAAILRMERSVFDAFERTATLFQFNVVLERHWQFEQKTAHL
jgi:hypothetical protein